MNNTTNVELRNYDGEIRRNYDELIDGTDISEVIDFFSDNGFRYGFVSGVESHDIGDQDYFSGHEKTDDPEKIKRFIKKLYGDWSIEAYLGDNKIRITNVYISIWSGIVFYYPASIMNEIEPVFKEFEKKFCLDKVVIVHKL